MLKRTIFYLAAIITVSACSQKQSESPDINKLAEDYIRLGLQIGQYDGSFVDAYYGPDSLKPKNKTDTAFPKQRFLGEVSALSDKLQKITSDTNAAVSSRAKWLLAQLKAFERRIKIFSGELADFDVESSDLFGVTAPKFEEKFFQQKREELDKLLPGNGSVFDRFQQLANKFIIPKNKIDTVFRTSILECRKRTLAHFTLPGQEKFELELVNNKPWSGYNWYKGHYSSLIQINTDINIFIDRAIDVGSHESYPGHHVYNMLLEENLYRGKGLIEISMYPLFSPQSFIAEGSGNYGIELAFPGDDRILFSKEVLLPLAGLDTSGITAYFRATAIRGHLNYVRNEVARGLINGTMNESQALEWLMKYGLLNEETAKKSIDFIRVNRTYVINYNYGLDAVAAYVNKRAGANATEDQVWKAFYQLLSEQIMTTEIVSY